VASAPSDQRNVTRMPSTSRLPRSWTWRPVRTWTPAWHLAVLAGTQRTPSSRGARDAAEA
jgi:hypothetical protein